MNLEPGIVKTVNLDNEQLLLIESPRGDCVCVIHRGVCLIGCRPDRNKDSPGGSNLLSWQPWRAWIRGLLTWRPTPKATSHWKALRRLHWRPA